jgi:hypothetical protein
VEKLTELLKKSTAIKNEQGNLVAINFLKELIVKNDLKESDALRCGKKIATFIKKEKSIKIEDASNYLLDILKYRIINNENRYDYFLALSDYYLDLKQYENALRMMKGALSSISPYEFLYLMKLRNTYRGMATIVLFIIDDSREKYLEYLYMQTAALIFNVVSEINYSIEDRLFVYYNYRDSDFTENDFLSDDIYETALNMLNISEKKNDIYKEIHKFVTYEIPLKMGFPDEILNNSLKEKNLDYLKPFDDVEMILKYAKELHRSFI